MSGTLSSLYSMFYETQQSKLGVLFLDVLLQENLTLPSDVTKYPIEDGSEDISDHITRGNEELTINGSVSSATSFGVEFGSQCYSKMIDAIDQLRKMHNDRKPITILTGLGKYEDMGFTQLTVQRQATNPGGQWLTINATLRKVKKVALKQTQLPPDNVSDGTKGKAGQTERRSGKSGESSPDKTDTLGKTMTHAGKDLISKLGTGIVPGM